MPGGPSFQALSSKHQALGCRAWTAPVGVTYLTLGQGSHSLCFYRFRDPGSRARASAFPQRHWLCLVRPSVTDGSQVPPGLLSTNCSSFPFPAHLDPHLCMHAHTRRSAHTCRHTHTHAPVNDDMAKSLVG